METQQTSHPNRAEDSDHLRNSIYDQTSKSSLLKGIDIHSTWDGAPDHAALVRIDIVVESEPDTRLVLLDLANDLFNSAVVTDVQMLSAPLSTLISKEAWQPSSERLSDTLIPFSTQGTFNKSTLQTPYRPNCCTDVEESLPSSKRRLFPISRSVASNSSILRRKYIHKSSPLETPSRVLSIESASSLSCETVEVHPESKISYPIEYQEQSSLPLQKYNAFTEATKVPSCRHCEACKTLGVMPQRHRSVRKTLEEQDERLDHMNSWSENTVFKESTCMSGMDAFSSDFVELCTSDLLTTNSAAKQASIRGIQANEVSTIRSDTLDSNGSPFSRMSSHLSIVALKCGGQYQKNLLPCIGKPSLPQSIENNRNGQNGVSASRDSSLMDSRKSPSTNALPSPTISPRVWLRRNLSSGQYFPGIETRRSTPCHNSPSTTTIDDMLQLHFPRDVIAGIYRIQIEARMLVSRPDTDGWRDFIIPGLLRPQETTIFGAMSFHLTQLPMMVDEHSLTRLNEFNSTTSCPLQAQFDTSHLIDVEAQEPTKIVGGFNLQNSLLVRLRLKEPIHQITEWSGSVILCTSAVWSKEQGLRLKHHASLTIERTNQDVFAERISFSLLIKNVSSIVQHHNLKSGEFSISVEDTGYQDEQQEYHTEMTITRDAQDLFSPLEIYFTASYPARSAITIPLPSIYPKSGEILSEKILLAEPPPPLVIEYQTRGLFTTWKCTEVFEGKKRITKFDRSEIPRLLPQGLKDDVILEIKELNHVRFQAVKALEDALVLWEPFDLVWNLSIKINRVYGKDLECRMSFDIQVGHDERLLTIAAQNWVPDLSIIEHRISLKSTGEWREDESGNLTLFNFSRIAFGQIIKVQMRWKEPGDHEVRGPRTEYLLPNIIGKSVLRGSLKCIIDGAICFLHNGEAKDDIFCFSNNSARVKTRLPMLHPHYALRLSIPNVRFRLNLTRTIRFADEDCENSSEISNESQSSRSFSETSVDTQSHDTNSAAETQGDHSEKTSPHDEDNVFAGQNERIRENILGNRSEPESQPILMCGIQVRWGRLLFLDSPFKFLTGLFERIRRTFILTCVIQLALAQICQIWNPFDITHLFSRSSFQYSDCKSRSGLDTIVNGKLAKRDGDLSITEGSGEKEIGNATWAENGSQHVGESRHEEPMDEVAKVMDWIDRALGWKAIDAS